MAPDRRDGQGRASHAKPRPSAGGTRPMKVFTQEGGRGWAARDRSADRAADSAGGIVTPQGAETPRPFPAGGSVALIKRDRARPPEDKPVRGRARPALARYNVRGRLDNSASRGSAFILPSREKESEPSELLEIRLGNATLAREQIRQCAPYRGNCSFGVHGSRAVKA
jgi:hypothetical protein